MTESEWTACKDPTPMLRFLKNTVSDSTLRLFACACCRRIWEHIRDKRSRRAIDCTERFVAGAVSETKRQQVAMAAKEAALSIGFEASFDQSDVAGIIAGAAYAAFAATNEVQSATAASVAGETTWNRTTLRWCAAMLALALGCAVANYYCNLYGEEDERYKHSAAASCETTAKWRGSLPQ